MTVSATDPLIKQAAQATGLPASVVAAQVNVESGGDPTALSPAGAEGEFQFLPSTYTGLGFPAGTEDDPSEEVKAYIKYMGQLLSWAGGDVRQALAGYNAGQGNWQAGLGYADTILGNAKEPPGIKTVTGPGGPPAQGSGSGISPWVIGVLRGLGIGLPEVSALTGGSDIGDAIAAVAGPLIKIAEMIDWFVHPDHWIRIFAGLFGGALVVGGIWQMSHAGGG